MSKKALGVVIKLVSLANTGYFYTTTKNARLPKKLLLRKYDPIVRQHVLFKASVVFPSRDFCFSHKISIGRKD